MNDPDSKIPSEPFDQHIDFNAIDDAIRKRKEDPFIVPHEPPRSKFIPAEILDQALAEASLPEFVRKIGRYTVDICETVADLKAARKLGKSPSVHISRLLDLIGDALANEEWTAMDNLAAAWVKMKPKPCNSVYRGEDYPFSELPAANDPKRQPLGWIVVQSIRELQRDLGRIPFRGEILDRVVYYQDSGGMDETELSRQLRRFNLAKWIPKQTKSSKAAAASDAENED